MRADSGNVGWTTSIYKKKLAGGKVCVNSCIWREGDRTIKDKEGKRERAGHTLCPKTFSACPVLPFGNRTSTAGKRKKGLGDTFVHQRCAYLSLLSFLLLRCAGSVSKMPSPTAPRCNTPEDLSFLCSLCSLNQLLVYSNVPIKALR